MLDAISIEDVRVPVKILFENRLSHRFSIARKSAIARIPTWYLGPQKTATINAFKRWVEGHYRREPKHFDRFRVRSYEQISELNLMGKPYQLNIDQGQGNKTKAKLNHSAQTIQISKAANGEDVDDVELTKCIKRIVAKGFKSKVKDRLDYFAKEVVDVEYNMLRLKDSVSNWGSCSGKKNINISIRTLLLPAGMIDYVLIHELCHLKELNHSPKFWAHVKKAMPNYEVAEHWINSNGNKYYY